MEDPHVPRTPALHDDDQIRRLRRLYRRTWGASLAVAGFLLLAAFVVGLIFLRWLWSLIEGSPTIS
jgi:hypothetical protein